jgi:hypothetical protein
MADFIGTAPLWALDSRPEPGGRSG